MLILSTMTKQSLARVVLAVGVGAGFGATRTTFARFRAASAGVGTLANTASKATAATATTNFRNVMRVPPL